MTNQDFTLTLREAADCLGITYRQLLSLTVSEFYALWHEIGIVPEVNLTVLIEQETL